MTVLFTIKLYDSEKYYHYQYMARLSFCAPPVPFSQGIHSCSSQAYVLLKMWRNVEDHMTPGFSKELMLHFLKIAKIDIVLETLLLGTQC